MQGFLILIVLAMLVESVWETLKLCWEHGKVSLNKIGVIIVSMMMAVMCNVSLFTLLNINIAVPMIGCILTGILLSRGADFTHKLIRQLMTANDPPIDIK
jgi:hypothetical protein